MDIPKLNYHSIFINEGGSFYSEIFSLDVAEFNSWVMDNFKHFGKCDSFHEVIPSSDILITLDSLGYKHREAQCHYNAKSVSIHDKRFLYVTGMLITNDSYNQIMTHSYNLLNGKIIDFSRLCDDKHSTLEDPMNSLPHEYFGIEIPNEFVQRYREETLDEYSMKPLLREWYLVREH